MVLHDLSVRKPGLAKGQWPNVVNNNPFYGPLSMMTLGAGIPEKNHSLTPCLCSYTIFVINFLESSSTTLLQVLFLAYL